MGVNKKLDGSPESEKETFPYAEIFEYKVLQGIRAELLEFGFRSHIVGSPNYEYISQGGVPQFVLQVSVDTVQWRVWLVDGLLRVRVIVDGSGGDGKSVGFDITDPNSISNLFEFMGVRDGI